MKYTPEGFERAVLDVVTALTHDTVAHKAVKYLEKKFVVKATRQGRFDARAAGETFVLTFGKPNYAERQFIQKCEQAGEPFPVNFLEFWRTK